MQVSHHALSFSLCPILSSIESQGSACSPYEEVSNCPASSLLPPYNQHLHLEHKEEQPRCFVPYLSHHFCIFPLLPRRFHTRASLLTLSFSSRQTDIRFKHAGGTDRASTGTALPCSTFISQGLFRTHFSRLRYPHPTHKPGVPVSACCSTRL